jgi:hypothetical protein
MKMKYITAILIILTALTQITHARTKLTTLPARDFIRVDLKNEVFTLIEEERTITLQKGRNQVEFAWANTYIDMSSIQFRNIKSPGTVQVLNVNYPPSESALFWEVYSDKAGAGVFRISYLISNLNREISYEAISDSAEKMLNIKSHVTLRNLSGEKFENAKLELGFGRDYSKTFEMNESKKMLSDKFSGVQFQKMYHFDPNIGKNVRMMYEILNSPENKMGGYPLSPGKVRIYQEDQRGTEAFLGEDWGQYTPRGEKLKLYLGDAKEVKIERNLYTEKKEYVKEPVYNMRRVIKFTMENFKNSEIPLTIHEHTDGEWEIIGAVLKIEKGERTAKTEEEIPLDKIIVLDKKDVNNLQIKVALPKTKEIKYNLYVEILNKNIW